MSKPNEARQLPKRILGSLLVLLGIRLAMDTYVEEDGNFVLAFTAYMEIFIGLRMIVASTKLFWGEKNEELQPLNYFEAEANHLKDKKSWRKGKISESSLLDELRAVSSYKKIGVVFFVILIFVLAHVASHRANEVRNGMNIYLSFTPAKQPSYFGSDLIGCGKQGNAAGNPNPDPQNAKYIFDLSWQQAHFRLQDAQGQIVESLGDFGEGSSNIGTCWITLSFTKLRDFAAPIYIVDDNGFKYELNAVQLLNRNIEIVGDGLHL